MAELRVSVVRAAEQAYGELAGDLDVPLPALLQYSLYTALLYLHVGSTVPEERREIRAAIRKLERRYAFLPRKVYVQELLSESDRTQ